MRENKKSETLEVRLSFDQKRAFMDACAEENVTASEKIRGFISEFVKDHELRRRTVRRAMMTVRKNPLKSIAAATAIIIAGIASGIAPTAAEDPLFAAWDKNSDRHIAADELSCGPVPRRYTGSNRLNFKNRCDAIVVAMDINNNGAIDLEEFTPIGRTTLKTDTILLVAGERKRRLNVDVIEWDAQQPPSIMSGVSSSAELVALDADQEEVDGIYQRLMRQAEETAAGAHYPSEELNRL